MPARAVVVRLGPEDDPPPLLADLVVRRGVEELPLERELRPLVPLHLHPELEEHTELLELRLGVVLARKVDALEVAAEPDALVERQLVDRRRAFLRWWIRLQPGRDEEQDSKHAGDQPHERCDLPDQRLRLEAEAPTLRLRIGRRWRRWRVRGGVRVVRHPRLSARA